MTHAHRRAAAVARLVTEHRARNPEAHRHAVGLGSHCLACWRILDSWDRGNPVPRKASS